MSLRTATLDVFDDGGALLRARFPTKAEVPDVVKLAAAIERDDQRQEDFAVVLVEGEDALPRYPLCDKGHTALSVLYFGETHGQLPPEAQKVASVRLREACKAYGLGTPKFVQDLAGDLRGVDPIVYLREDDEIVSIAEAPEGVSYAYEGRYPLGSPAEIRAAMRYLEENAVHMAPAARHTFATNVAAAAEDAGLHLSDELAKHAGTDWNPSLPAHLMVREHILRERSMHPRYVETLSKLAAARVEVEPEEFAEGLMRFDQLTGLDDTWGKELYDPYACVFEKRAQNRREVGKSWKIGFDYVTEVDLRAAATDSVVLNSMEQMIGDDIQKFRKNPVSYFEGLNDDMKILVARVASERLRGQ